MQAVVNALWAGGAEAMSIMNVRVLATSAVRCVGNTLLLHGRVYCHRSRSWQSAIPLPSSRPSPPPRESGCSGSAVDDYHLGYSEHAPRAPCPHSRTPTALRSATVPP